MTAVDTYAAEVATLAEGNRVGEHELRSDFAPDAAMLMLLLCLCPVPTVRDYASNIFTKLHIADRAQASLNAREAGLGRRGGAAW